MLTDTAALAVAWAAVRIACGPPTSPHLRLSTPARAGDVHQRLCAAVHHRLDRGRSRAAVLQPEPVDGAIILWIGSAGLAVNLLVFALLRRGDSHDMNIAAATLHVLSDMLGSVAAIVAALVILSTGWTPIDPLLSLGRVRADRAQCLVADPTLDSYPDGRLARRPRRRRTAQDAGAARTLDSRRAPRSLVAGRPARDPADHARVGPVDADHSAVLREAKTVLAEHYGITHATIQIEAEECVDEDCGPSDPLMK